MPPCSRPDLCNGAKNGPSCFYARRLCQGEYNCIHCGVEAPFTLATPTFKSWCIQCFYQHPDNRAEACRHSGCRAGVEEIQARILSGRVDLSSSAEAPPGIASAGGATSSGAAPARNPLQDLRAEVEELKAQVNGMQEQIDALVARQQGQNQWYAWDGR